MRDGVPSQTAVVTAFIRALHSAGGSSPRVFDDPVAELYLSTAQRRIMERVVGLTNRWQMPLGLPPTLASAVASQVLVRARYTEDALAHAVSRACRRYVILGAGLDSYAERHRNDVEPLPVLEIDHPATQAWKLDRLQEKSPHGLAPAVTYRAVDFETQSLEAAFDGDTERQFVSWLGTTYYLTRDAIAQTLRVLHEQSAPGSELVFDYWRPSRVLGTTRLLEWGSRLAVAVQPEPLQSFLEPAEIETMVVAAGWRIREHCAPAIQNARYLSRRSDGLRVPGFAFLMHLER
ncbi:MAG: SAM-dependent methyltransferase [Pseudomonadota bacterium]